MSSLPANRFRRASAHSFGGALLLLGLLRRDLPALAVGGLPQRVSASARTLAASGSALLLALALAAAGLVALAAYRQYQRCRREERFGALFDASPDPLLLLDGTRCVMEANEAACELLGRSPSQLHGRRLDDFLEANGAESPRTAFEELEAARKEADDSGGTTFQAEVRLDRPDGSAREGRLRLRSVSAGGGRRVVASLQDMTSTSAEQALFRHFHRRTLEDLPLEMAVLSPDGTYLYANPAACTDGISSEWLSGRTDFDVCERMGLHPEVALRRRSHRRRALRSGERVKFREVLSRRDAPPRHIERFYAPVLEKEGDAVHAIVTYAHDRTEEKRRKAALVEAERASEEYEELKTTLLRNLRHEFRTPLTSILSASEVLREEVDPHQEDFVDIVHESGQRLFRTLSALLDLAGTQTGGTHDREQRVVCLSEAVDSVIEELGGEAEDKGLFLRKQVSALRPVVRADPAGIHRVLRSIVGNAVKFTEEGGAVIEVDKTQDGMAEVRVIDTGVGIDEAYRARLFDSFGQEDGSITRSFEGVGVGLAVAHRLVSLMGGSVTVDSEKGEGSVFTISLPLAFRGASGEAPHVLVVESREEQRKMLHHHLGAHVQLTFTHALDDALEAARERRFASVLVSANLSTDTPAGDLVERFRQIEHYEDVPLVAIDENALPGAAEQFEADGYDGYVARPLQRARLLNVLGDVLQERLLHEVDAPTPAEHPSGAQRRLNSLTA